MIVGGRVRAGRLDFFGTDLFFEYEGFRLDFANIDSVRLAVPADKPDEMGKTPLIRIFIILLMRQLHCLTRLLLQKI